MIFFKFPFNDQIFTTDENQDISDLSFVSFDGEKTVNIRGNIVPIDINKIPQIYSDKLSSENEKTQSETEETYIEKIAEVVDFIKENNLKKLVIARQKKVIYKDLCENGTLNLTKTFLNLGKTYPNAFAYFFYDKSDCWIGAFSEVLGKFNKENSEFETMSLAGTLPLNETWTAKEIEEQKPVTDYISNILQKYSQNTTQSETYSHNSGNIKHLRTDFKAKIDSKNLEQLISELHPTPAVCGIPKEFCKEAILDFENFSRKFYAGYIKVETENHIQYFVNLRCAEFTKNYAKIYVGGGITAQSDPAKEWRETELKSEAILKNLATS